MYGSNNWLTMDRLQILLNAEDSKSKINTDSYLKVNIDGKIRLLPPDVIDQLVSANDVFNNERQGSPFYRLLGTINPSITNALFNTDDGGPYLDLYTWRGFNYVDPQSQEPRFNNFVYPTVVKTFLDEKDGWFGYFDPNISNSGLCNYFDMEPKRQRFSFTPDTVPYHAPSALPVKNWELTVTYPSDIDSGHTMVNGGLLLVDMQPAVVSTRNMTAIGLACLHNLTVGDIVRLSGTTGYNGDFVVVRTGLDNGDLQGNYFVIDLPPTGALGFNARMKRVFAGTESTYYFRLFSKLPTRDNTLVRENDYEIYNLAFSENSYYDSITQFVFNADLNVSGLTDNLGRPLSELYLTVIKTDSNGLFGNVSSGIETPFIAELNTSNLNTYLQNIPVISKIHNGNGIPFPSHIPLEASVTIINNNNLVNNNHYYGDLVEYNVNELQETVLADVFHRFNTINRETTNQNLTYILNEGSLTAIPIVPPTYVTVPLGPRQEGYYYKAHNIIRIRNFSTYIEQGDQNTVGIPDYATQIDDGRYLWRDLLDIGFNETSTTVLDYPFLNGCHYMYDNYCFSVRRQDPFDDWDLYYSQYPADPVGEKLTDKFTIFSTEDVC